MNLTTVICSKCGRPEEYDKAVTAGWLIAQRKGEPEGWLIVRCPQHITDHARKLAGLRQEYYHQKKEIKMSHTFNTLQEALDAGYRTVNRRADKDTSGPNSFGYSYENDEGEETVTVWIEQERNKAGRLGAFRPMYPPKES